MTSTRPVVKTTCAYCGVGCGIQVQVENKAQRRITLEGDPAHPANFGKLCAKGATLAETTGLEKRLLHPRVHGRNVDWDTATDFIARKFQRIIQDHGPDAIGIYLSGQLLTEDYYVANKFAKGFLGTANIDTNSRLCMSSSVVGHKRAFGEDLVPTCYEDIDHADLMVLVGSNTAWCHPIVFQRIKKAKQQNPALKIVVIDPRRTDTCDMADLHLAVNAGTDVLLFNGLLAWLADQQALDRDFIDNHCDGFADTLQQAQSDGNSLQFISQQCGVSHKDLTTFYEWFQATDKTLTFYSQGVNQSRRGSDKVNAIINCHLATGRIGKPGAGPFSLTGQPNAMGGREVGGLANQLAAHMDFDTDSVARVSRFWNAPNMATQPGLKTIELFEAARQGKIKALWIMATNPAVSLPDNNRVREALQKCELVIVSDCIAETDTMSFAHVQLPAQGWGEKDGMVTNSDRSLSRQRAFLDAPGDARPDWQIVTRVARAMGFDEAFDFQSAADVFREHARLSGFENDEHHRLRFFNLSAMADMTPQDYDQWQPAQWPFCNEPQQRLFADGRFSTPSKKAQFVPTGFQPVANATNIEFPLQLNTGRIRDQWHTMTRTAFAPRLNAHKTHPFVEIHPNTATRFRIANGDIVKIASPWGHMLAVASLTDSIKPQQVFIPIHWNDQFAACGRVGPLVNPDVDPHSGQPELKHTPVSISRYRFPHYARFWSRDHSLRPACDYWVKVVEENNLRFDLAHHKPLDHDTLIALNKVPSIQYQDATRSIVRLAWFRGERLEACLFMAPQPLSLNDRWISQLFNKDKLEPQERQALLSGQAPADVEDMGAIICACHSVGEKTIINAIQQGCCSAAAVGDATKAGTNCGSCVGEINAMVKQFGQGLAQPQQ